MIGVTWFGLQIVHEFGHVLGAWATGGQVQRVVLHPLAISRTDVSPNPQPLVERWAGPVVGVLLPLVLLSIAWPFGRNARNLFRFFAGACLIANGLYLAIGSFGRVGDAGDLLRHGAPIWTLWLFGLVTVPAALWLWSGIGDTFGFGAACGVVSLRATIAVLVLLVAVIAIELALSQN
jgi:Peptidase M50B-like